jgi:hypothetical protein
MTESEMLLALARELGVALAQVCSRSCARSQRVMKSCPLGFLATYSCAGAIFFGYAGLILVLASDGLDG